MELGHVALPDAVVRSAARTSMLRPAAGAAKKPIRSIPREHTLCWALPDLFSSLLTKTRPGALNRSLKGKTGGMPAREAERRPAN